MVGYLVHSADDRKKMLKSIGMDDIKSLYDFIPNKILEPKIDLPKGLSERDLFNKLNKLASLNKPISKFSSFLGGGAYNHYIPQVVKDICSISQFYTAYTPYQAEISQGTLQYIFEFQSLICRLTGMDVSNASMYDGATALAEAIILSSRVNKKNKAIIANTINPEYRETVKTYLYGLEIDIEEIGCKDGITDLDKLKEAIDDNTCAVAVQNPNFFGCFEDVFKINDLLKNYPDCLYIICANPLSLALIKPPTEYGADIVVGDAQVFGSPLSFGGPYLGYFAAREKYLRQMPGRIVGKSVDRVGNDAYILTFQTREQHIRKTKATSNICSNHSLNALAATAYLSILGEKGLKDLANICIQRARYFSGELSKLKHFKQKFKPKFFNELVINSEIDTNKILDKLYQEKIIGGIDLGKYYPELNGSILVSFTEENSIDEIDKYIDTLKTISNKSEVY